MFIISINPRLRRIAFSRELLIEMGSHILRILVRGDLEIGRFAFSKVIENE